LTLVKGAKALAIHICTFNAIRTFNLNERLTFRFAVGAFGDWQQLSAVLEDLRDREFVLQNFNCLALKQVFSGKVILTPSQQPLAIERLVLSGQPEEICCTSGPLATCLGASIEAGATTLKDALGLWLIPRHAAYLQSSVEDRKILLWLEVPDSDQERSACQSLLATSSGPVGVHDLVLGGRSI
jgi:hypothetical protein